MKTLKLILILTVIALCIEQLKAKDVIDKGITLEKEVIAPINSATVFKQPF